MYKSVSFSSFGASDGKNADIWRNKIEVPVFPPVGGRKGAITLKYRPIIAAVVILFTILLLYSYISSGKANINHAPSGKIALIREHSQQRKLMSYNRTYPLSKPISTSTGAVFQIGLITDMDTNSKCPDKLEWQSILLYGNLSYNQHTHKISVSWGNNGIDEGGIKLTSSYAYKGRGMELSELVVFNANVFTVDDRTGIVYKIIDNRVAPWAILSDGNGKQTKGFKGEWMAVKDEKLYIGGLGKEWTTPDGTVLHSNPQWVKVLDKDRSVTDLNWVPHYKAMQQASGYISPGYIIHESAVWSDIHKSWFFLPRRASHLKYDETLDEQRATNIFFKCSEDFSDINVKHIGHIDYPARGFSSFKFLPGSHDQIIVALKTEEVQGETKSYITAFTIDGDILMTDTLVSRKYKYEGVEFL